MKKPGTFSLARAGIMLALTASLSVLCIPSVMAQADEGASLTSADSVAVSSSEPAQYAKAEVVYANLSSSGAPEAVYVVNRFDVASAGSVIDFGDYEWVRNLSIEDPIERSGDSSMLQLDAGTYYYQGAARSTELPWIVKVDYTLDGNLIAAEELAGKSGHLGIRITTQRNDAVDRAFYESFMLQITFSLPDEKACNVKAPNATLASSGSNRTVAFTVLPGNDGDFALEADVTDFEMSGATIAGVPYTSVIEMPDTDSMVADMSQLSDAVSQLDNASDQLAGGAGELAAGVQTLANGVSELGAGLEALNQSGQGVTAASSQIAEALSQQASALSQVVEALAASIDPEDPSQAALMQQIVPLQQIASGLVETAEQYAGFDAGLVQYVDGVAQTVTGYDQIKVGVDGIASGVNELAEGARQLAGGTSTLNSSTITLPDTMRQEIDAMMADFEFPEYAHVSFASDKNSPVEEVQFVMTLGDISVPEAEVQEEAEPQLTFWDRLLALFS